MSPAPPNQSACVAQVREGEPELSGPTSAPIAARTHAAPSRTQSVVGRTPLMRFWSLQHSLAATRCPRQPAWDNPASAFVRWLVFRAVADRFEPTRPCGFTLLQTRCGRGLVWAMRAPCHAAFITAAQRRAAHRSMTVACGRRRSIRSSALTGDPSHQAPPHHACRSNAGHAPARSFGAAFRYPPTRILRGLAGRIAPSLKIAQRRSWGSGSDGRFAQTKGFFCIAHERPLPWVFCLH